MTIKPNDMVSVEGGAYDEWETVLWTPSGQPVGLFIGTKSRCENKRDQVESVIRQWARVLRNVEEVT